MADSGASIGDTKWDVVKEGTVSCAGKQLTLRLTANNLVLKEDDSNSKNAKKTKGLDLSWCDVIAAELSKKSKGNGDKSCFCLHYMELQSNKKLQAKGMEISCSDQTADLWIDTIQKQCASVEGRPKKLFVLINPIGGSQSGQKVYEKKVQPLFELAQIEAVAKVTERAKHALEIAENQDFSSFDGIVVMGGDGTYHEILQGCAIKTQKAAGVDYHDSNTQLKPLTKPIGVIPTGTGNGMSGFINGVVDVETAILRIIRGEQHPATVFTIHSNRKLFAICGLLVAYGFFSDLIKRTDELRWMKRARYPYCLLASIFGKSRGFQCELEYRLGQDSSSGETPGASGDEAQGTDQSSKDSKWMTHDSKGRIFKCVSAWVANIERIGDKAYVDAYSDHISLMVDHGCSTISLYKHLFKFVTGKQLEPLPTNLEIIKNVQGIRLKLLKESAESEENLTGAAAKARELEKFLDIDGEVKELEVLEFEMSVIPSFVPVYGIRNAPV